MPTALETEIAELAVAMVPNIDKIRFVNSGTEACMSAIRLARGYTKKDKIIKFSGCYHGHSDAFLIAAGSGATTFGTPSSPGVTQANAKDTLVAEYNNIESVEALVNAHKNDIAAIIVEPVAGNMGCIPPEEGFLEALRTWCDANGILLIFDEVMTGFRLSKGGVQALKNVRADLICFGKIIGGGLPVGAFAGKNDIMNHLSPTGPVYQAGTLSGNPLAMSAGLAMLKAIRSDNTLMQRLQDKTAYLKKGITQALEGCKIVHSINSIGSMLSVHFSDTPVIDFKSATKANNTKFKAFFHGLLKNGVYIPPSAFESWFISDALSYKDLDQTIEAVGKGCENVVDRVKKR